MVGGKDKPWAGNVEDPYSKFYGRTMAPAVVNFQITCAMASLWRELHRYLLISLNEMYEGVYSGDKLRNWVKIFVVSAICLLLWEQMQFDSYYHMEVREALSPYDSIAANSASRMKTKRQHSAKRWNLL